MALIWKDRVLETSTTTGTGALTLAGAITGYRTFESVCSTNDTCYYYIEAVDGSGVPTGAWETGLGTYSGTNTLTRTTVIDSSNSGAAVNFSAGTKRVALSQLASNINLLTQGTSWANNVFATGTGASQQITLPEAGLSPKDVLVFVNGVRYNSNEYSISGTSLTITTNANNDSIEISKLAGYTTQTSHLTQIGQVTLSTANATIGFSNIPTYYEDLVIVTQARGDDASAEVELRAILNNDTAANYDGQKNHAYSTGSNFSQFTASSNAMIAYIPANNAPSSVQGQSTLELRNYKRTSFNKGGLSIWSSKNGTGTFSQGTGEYSFEWRNTAAVANVALSLSAGNFANGSTVTLYGRGGITNVGTPTNINSLSDVDTVTTTPVSGDLLSYNGTVWRPVPKTWDYSPPLASSFTLQSGDATNLTLTDDSDVGLAIDMGAPAAGDIKRGAYRTLTTPANDFVMTMKARRFIQNSNYNWAGLYLFDSVGGRGIDFAWQNDGTIAAANRNSPYHTGSFASTIASVAFASYPVEWLRIRAVSTTYYYDISIDGKNWVNIGSASRTAFLANNADRVGFMGAYARSTGFKGLANIEYFTLTGAAV